MDIAFLGRLECENQPVQVYLGKSPRLLRSYIQIGHNIRAHDLLHEQILITHIQCSNVQDSLKTPPSHVLWRLLTPIFVYSMSSSLNIRATIPDNSDIILNSGPLHPRQVHHWALELPNFNGHYACCFH